MLVGSRGDRWDALTLEPLPAYDLPTDRWGDRFAGSGVAVGSDGRAAFTTADFAPVEPVWTVPSGSLEPTRSYDLRRSDLRQGVDAWRLPVALALGAVDTYVVSRSDDGLRLDVLSPGPDATLTLGDRAPSYPYGARVRVPVQLDARSASRALDVGTAGVQAGFVAEPGVVADADGRAVVPLRLRRPTTVLVGYDAVDTSESVVARQLLVVRPRLTPAFPGARGGRVPTYPAGRSATLAVEVKGRPACVRIRVEQRTDRGWRSRHRSACDTPRRGRVSTTLPWRPALGGARLRVSVESRKDRYWAAAHAGPVRFRFR